MRSRSTAEPDKMGAFVAAITELEADLKARELARSAEVARKLKKEGENLMDALPADTVAACLPAWYIRERPEPPNT